MKTSDPLQNSPNPIVRFYQGLVKLVEEIMPKERAVNVEDIWHFAQDQLDATTSVDAAGNPVADGSAGEVVDVYVDSASMFVLIAKDDGKLYKAPITVDANNNITMGPQQEVSMEFAPVTNSRQLQIRRSADGQVRWFAFPACTAVLNRVGEIDSTALFDSFVSYAERTNQYPELDFWHLGERLVLGKADWIGRDGISYCASGTFYDTPIARAAIKALETQTDYWGLSIAYLPIQKPEQIRNNEGVKIPVYNVGINRFISLLPENAAASIMTSINTKEEVTRMNEKMKDALKKLIGDDQPLLDELSLKLDSVSRESAGMISRDDPAVVEDRAATPAATPAAASPKTQISPADIAAVINSPEFDAKVTEIVNKIYMATNSTEADAVKQNEKPDKLEALLVALASKVDDINKDRAAETQVIVDDLPAKMSGAKVYRKRATMLPGALVTQDRTKIDLAEVANRTLEKIGAAEA